MKLLFILGDSAVGKMTVGQELANITPLRLFHNHMMIEPVLEVFGQFRSDVIQRLRSVILEEFGKSGQYGLIFTYMMAFDLPQEY
ncbi:MAG: shikimate kinase, partial [Firmicutes bacterium]|nr:shikimate kinase [Bacillota bacterium]